MTIQIPSIAELTGYADREVAVSDWLLIDQATIDRFAEATNDRQWIHVDPERASTSMPGGRTIAHGFLLVSLLAPMFEDTISIGGTASSINYGFNRLRFTAPVPVGSEVRARFRLAAFEAIAGGAQLTWSVTIERHGQERPVLVAEWLMRRYAELNSRS
ncbi:MAG: MaoC family dehydratase [Xanthobacteraceae bacterium]